MANISDVFNTKIGDLVEFKYNGGTHPGVSRVVAVKNVDNRSLSGEDVFRDDKNKYRKFEFSKIYDFKVLRKEPILNNTVGYDDNLGLVVKNKKGDVLSLAVNKNAVAVSLNYGGQTSESSEHVAFSIPTNKDQAFNSFIDILRKFSK